MHLLVTFISVFSSFISAFIILTMTRIDLCPKPHASITHFLNYLFNIHYSSIYLKFFRVLSFGFAAKILCIFLILSQHVTCTIRQIHSLSVQ